MRYRAATVVLCALVAGCGGGGDEFPSGQWTATLPSAGPFLADYRADGIWTFSFREQDNWTEASSGAYSTTEDTITFETDAYCKSARPHVEQGTYAWAVDDQGRLILTVRLDPCPDRIRVLDGVAYTRVESPSEP